MKIVPYFISSLVALSFFLSCDKNDDISTDPNLRLSFSTDTLRFDTVFTSLGTATKKLKIYNRNKSALTISSIELMHPSTSGFRMNVDGESGNKISNIDILANDSLYVFVETTIDPLNRDNPLLIADSIRLQLNGVNQYIRLEAIGQDVVFWKNKVIGSDTIITDKKPFLIYDSLTIKNGATLSIKENTQLYFHKDAKLKIEGTLKASGTTAKPIVMRADRMDNIFESPPVSYDRVPGQWYGIEIAAGSYNNQFENLRIRNGVYGILCHPSDTSQTKASLLNTVIQNTTLEGLLATNCKIKAENSLFANSGNNTVVLQGGSSYFLHCTIANYLHRDWGLRKMKALYFGNTDKTNGNFRFINTIISGSSNSEIEQAAANESNLKYLFINCLIKISGNDDANFVNSIWNIDAAFKYIYSLETAKVNLALYYAYNYELSDKSPAINKASKEYATILPYDIRGKSRLHDTAPDIGCYEWKNNE